MRSAAVIALLLREFTRRGKPNHVMMPYCNALYPLADWFRQLWAESLGKRHDLEGREVFAGATPIKALGTTDQHSQVQLYREGPNDKVIMFLEVADFGPHQGLTIPLMTSATATFLFRQFYLTIPNEMAEAAQLDGAGPLRFLWSFLLPLSWANIAALFVVLFIYGWNQYLWPLMITNTEAMRTVVIGLEGLIPRSGTELPTWNLIMAGAMMALLPPVAIIVLMQRWFVKGLVESEK